MHGVPPNVALQFHPRCSGSFGCDELAWCTLNPLFVTVACKLRDAMRAVQEKLTESSHRAVERGRMKCTSFDTSRGI
jgi:hypothetical protein